MQHGSGPLFFPGGTRIGVLILACLLSAPTAVRAAASESASNTDKRIRASRTTSPLTIDGILDEDAWRDAATIKDAHQVLPFEYTAPSERTEFYVLYDKDMLYVGGRFWDSEPGKITARVLQQGGNISTDDHIFIILDPFNSKRSGYFFFMNANNVRSDGLFDGPKFLSDWDGIWQGKATLTEDGWSAEIAIPMKTLSFPAGNDTWGFNVSRDVARKTERISWVSRNRTIDPSAAGEIYGLTDLDVGLGLDVVPSISLGERRDLVGSNSESVFEPSLDLFYKITPSMNGSLTINTDFSATEVDERQINVTRFNLFFPEKRKFFLKDTDIFEFGRIGTTSTNGGSEDVGTQNGRPFFSRTIGLSDAGMPVPLDLGAKLSGRIGEWNLGMLAVRQEEAPPLQAQNLFVGRVTRNVLNESTIGLILTRGDPQSSVESSLAGIDFRYRNTDTPLGVIEAETWYQLTDTESLHDHDRAWGVGARVPNQTGLRGGIAVREIQENFNPALGFVNRHGVRNYSGDIGYTFRPQGRYLNEIFTGLEVDHTDRISGSTESSTTRLRLLEMKNRRGDAFFLRIHRENEGLVEPFEIFSGIVIEPGDYKWNNYGVILRTAQHRTLSANMAMFIGNDYDGRRRAGRFGFNWKPSRHFNLEGATRYSDYELPVGDFFIRLMTLKATLIVSDTLSWSNLLQFDNQSNLLGVNSRLHWIPQARRELFFVINHELMDEATGFRSTNADITLKINYTLRF